MATASPNTVKRLKPAASARRARRGLTLIELVMVVALLGLLAAIAIPGVQMAVEGRRVREAARSVNVFLGSASNRAVVTGRPIGVIFERFSSDTSDPYQNVCMTLHQVEAPPPYAGEVIGALAAVQVNGGGLQVQFVDSASDDPENALGNCTSFAAAAVRAGDRIQFNHQGFWYRIGASTATEGTSVSGDRIALSIDLGTGQYVPWDPTGEWSQAMPYEIRRQPRLPSTADFRVAIAKPLQLPLDAVIDMTFSGGSAQRFGRNAFSGTAPVIIMFSPDGGLDRVYVGNVSSINEEHRPTESFHLLIGKRERIPATAADDGLSNLQDPETLWVSISPRTGSISTAENGSLTVGPADEGDISVSDPIYWARRYARQMQNMGGR